MKTTMTRVRCVGVSSPIRTDMPRTATEVNALSLRGIASSSVWPIHRFGRDTYIWMKETLSVRYAMLLKMREAEKRAPMGTIFLNHLSHDICTLYTPSRRRVVRSMILVPIVANVRCHVVRKMGLSSITRRSASTL